MSEWTVHIETPPETTRDEEALERFAASFQENETALGAAVLMDVGAGQLSATFQVDAPSRDDAALIGCFAYWRALQDTGLNLGVDSRVEVEPTEPELVAEPERHAEWFNVRVLLERAEAPV